MSAAEANATRARATAEGLPERTAFRTKADNLQARAENELAAARTNRLNELEEIKEKDRTNPQRAEINKLKAQLELHQARSEQKSAAEIAALSKEASRAESAFTRAELHDTKAKLDAAIAERSAQLKKSGLSADEDARVTNEGKFLMEQREDTVAELKAGELREKVADLENKKEAVETQMKAAGKETSRGKALQKELAEIIRPLENLKEQLAQHSQRQQAKAARDSEGLGQLAAHLPLKELIDLARSLPEGSSTKALANTLAQKRILESQASYASKIKQLNRLFDIKQTKAESAGMQLLEKLGRHQVMERLLDQSGEGAKFLKTLKLKGSEVEGLLNDPAIGHKLEQAMLDASDGKTKGNELVAAKLRAVFGQHDAIQAWQEKNEGLVEQRQRAAVSETVGMNRLKESGGVVEALVDRIMGASSSLEAMINALSGAGFIRQGSRTAALLETYRQAKQAYEQARDNLENALANKTAKEIDRIELNDKAQQLVQAHRKLQARLKIEDQRMQESEITSLRQQLADTRAKLRDLSQRRTGPEATALRDQITALKLQLNERGVTADKESNKPQEQAAEEASKPAGRSIGKTLLNLPGRGINALGQWGRAVMEQIRMENAAAAGQVSFMGLDRLYGTALAVYRGTRNYRAMAENARTGREQAVDVVSGLLQKRTGMDADQAQTAAQAVMPMLNKYLSGEISSVEMRGLLRDLGRQFKRTEQPSADSPQLKKRENALQIMRERVQLLDEIYDQLSGADRSRAESSSLESQLKAWNTRLQLAADSSARQQAAHEIKRLERKLAAVAGQKKLYKRMNNLSRQLAEATAEVDKLRSETKQIDSGKEADQGAAIKLLELKAAEKNLEKLEFSLDLARSQGMRHLTDITIQDVSQASVRRAINLKIHDMRESLKAGKEVETHNIQDRILLGMAENANILEKKFGKEFKEQTKQLAFAYKVAEFTYLSSKFAGRGKARDYLQREALRMAAGYGKEDGFGIGLVTAYKMVKADRGSAPKYLFATADQALVAQMAMNPLIRSMGNEVKVISKESAIVDPHAGGIYLTDQKTMQEILLEAKSGNKLKAAFLKSFEGGAVDEIQAALSATPVIHGVSGQILSDIYEAHLSQEQKQVLNENAKRYELAMKEVLIEYFRHGESFADTFRNRERQVGTTIRNTWEVINKDELVARLQEDYKDAFKDISRTDIERLTDLAADAIMKINGRDYRGDWSNGEFDYHVMGNGKLMLHTVFGDAKLAAMVAIKENLLNLIGEGNKRNLVEAVKAGRGEHLIRDLEVSLKGTAIRLMHFKTGEATFIEVMSYIGADKFIVGSATLEGNKKSLDKLGFEITSLTGESTLELDHRVVIEGMQLGEKSHEVGERDQLVFKLDGKIYEFETDDAGNITARRVTMDAQTYLVDKLVEEMRDYGKSADGKVYDIEVVTDIDNAKNMELYEAVKEKLTKNGTAVNAVVVRDTKDVAQVKALRDRTDNREVDLIVITGDKDEAWTKGVEEIRGQIKVNPNRRRIVIAVGVGEGSNIFAKTDAGKYSASIIKTNMAAYDKNAQTARRGNAPNRESGKATMFFDFDNETNIRSEEKERIRAMLTKDPTLSASSDEEVTSSGAAATQARNEVVEVTREMLREIDQGQAASADRILRGQASPDVVEVAQRETGKPTAKEMAAYRAKAVEIIEQMKAENQGLEHITNNMKGRKITAGVKALRAASANARLGLMKSYQARFAAETGNDQAAIDSSMAAKFGATWKMEMDLGGIQFMPPGIKQDWTVKWPSAIAAPLRALRLTAPVNGAINGLLNGFAAAYNQYHRWITANNMLRTERSDATKLYQGLMSDIAKVGAKLSVFENNPNATLTYQNRTMNEQQARAYLVERMDQADSLALRYGLKSSGAVQNYRSSIERHPQLVTNAALQERTSVQTMGNRVMQTLSALKVASVPWIKAHPILAAGLLASMSTLVIVNIAGGLMLLGSIWTVMSIGGGLLAGFGMDFLQGRAPNNKFLNRMGNAPGGKIAKWLTPAGMLLFSNYLGVAGFIAGKLARVVWDVRQGKITATPIKEDDVVVNLNPAGENNQEGLESQQVLNGTANMAGGKAKTIMQAWQEEMKTTTDGAKAAERLFNDPNIGVQLTVGKNAQINEIAGFMVALADVIPFVGSDRKSEIRSAIEQRGVDFHGKSVAQIALDADLKPETGTTPAMDIAIRPGAAPVMHRSFTDILVNQALLAAKKILFNDNQLAGSTFLDEQALMSFLRQYIFDGESLAAKAEDIRVRQSRGDLVRLRENRFLKQYDMVRQAFNGVAYTNADLTAFNEAKARLENKTFAAMEDQAKAFEQAQKDGDSQGMETAWKTFMGRFGISYDQYLKMKKDPLLLRVISIFGRDRLAQGYPVRNVRNAINRVFGLGAAAVLAAGVIAGIALGAVAVAVGLGAAAALGLALVGYFAKKQARNLAFRLNPPAAVMEQLSTTPFQGQAQVKAMKSALASGKMTQPDIARELGISLDKFEKLFDITTLLKDQRFANAVERLRPEEQTFMISENSKNTITELTLRRLIDAADSGAKKEFVLALLDDAKQLLAFEDINLDIAVKPFTFGLQATVTPTEQHSAMPLPVATPGIWRAIERLREIGVQINGLFAPPVNMHFAPNTGTGGAS